MKFCYPTVFVLSLVIGGAAVAARPSSVSQADQASWTNWLIPLPKQIAIEGKVQVPSSGVGVVVAGPASETVQTAANELRALLGQKGEAGSTQARFTILLGTCDPNGKLGDVVLPDAAQLAKLPNPEQAYLIRPAGDTRLVLTARDPRGVYYAAQTMRQLLESRLADGQVTIPLVRVMDWPDLAERGLWGGSANRDIVWMAQHKMNLVESHVTLGMTAEGRGTAQADQKLIDLGRRHALKFVPVITHLNGVGRTGIYRLYPELQGKGPRAVHPTHTSLVAPCCSQSKLVDILADWMIALAGQKGVSDVCAWLSELERQYCDCDRCRQSGVGQFAMEARTLLKAYRLAQKTHPRFGLRILLTQGSYDTNDKVLAEIPPDVGVTYYDGGRTYDSTRNPMIYPLVEQYAARGGWLGCYPQLTASWRIVCPWSGPQFIRFRMNEFVDKKLQCLCGYATPDNRLYDFNVLAAAEWSWNAKGRDERAFAAAWATRRRLPAAETAEWAVMLGPVGWDVYGSGVPFSQFFGRAQAMIARRQKPKFGEGILRYFPSAQHLDADLATCGRALEIARRLKQPLLVAETQTIQSYLCMIKAIQGIAARVAAVKQPAYAERVEIQKDLGRLCVASLENVEHLQEWERLCSQGTSERAGGSRLLDTVDATEKTVTAVARSLERIGIRNPLGPYLREEIGRWVTEDFDQQARITKRIDVTRYVTVPGVYEVGFTYSDGWNGLSIQRVALAAAPADKPDQPTELSVDAHPGSAAARNRANVYTLTLKEHDPGVKFFVVADIRGTPRHGRPPERQGCNGVIWIKGKRPDDWRARIERATPLTDEQIRRKR